MLSREREARGEADVKRREFLADESFRRICKGSELLKRKIWLLPTLAGCLFLSLTLLSGATPRAQTSAVETSASALSPAPYRTGEKLSYNVSFSRFSTAAHVEMFVAGRTAVSGRETVELRAHVETLGVVSAALYALNNDYTSFVDASTGLPVRTRQVVREGALAPIDAARDYNQPAGASAVPERQTAGGFPGTLDLLSAVYRLRALPLAEGSAYRFTVQGTNELYDAELRVTGSELLKTNIGSFNSIATQVAVRKNPAANDYRIRIYFSSDERHVPLLITARHPSGEIRAEIASAEFVDESPAPAVPAVAGSTPAPPGRMQAAPGTPRVIPPGTTGANPSTTGASPGANASAGDGADGDGEALSGLPFKVGEQLNYRFFLGDAAQPVGAASLQVRARARYFDREGLLLTASMGTTGAGLRLFPVNDQISSYVDATTLLPFRTELRMQEGRRNFNALVTVDQSRGDAIFSDGTRLEIPVATHDLVSVFYALRSFDLTPPRRNGVSLLLNKRPRTLFVSALRREIIEVSGQRIPAVQLSLTTDDTQRPDALQIRIWVSADQRRLPLRLTAVTPLGPVRGDLAIIPVSFQ